MRIDARHASALLLTCSTTVLANVNGKPVTLGDVRDALERTLDDRSTLHEAADLLVKSRAGAPDDTRYMERFDRLAAAVAITRREP